MELCGALITFIGSCFCVKGNVLHCIVVWTDWRQAVDMDIQGEARSRPSWRCRRG